MVQDDVRVVQSCERLCLACESVLANFARRPRAPAREVASARRNGSKFSASRLMVTTPIPPRPRHSRISSCGKCGAMCSGGSGGCATGVSPVKTESGVRFNAMRQFGQRPSGASGGRIAPHCGHFGIGSVFMPVT